MTAALITVCAIGLVLPAVCLLCACILSSQISREEERKQ